MPSIYLTELAVKKLKPTPGKQIDYFDRRDGRSTGLILRVNPGGVKTWKVIYYVGRRTKTKRLGRWPIFNVAEARERARLFLQDPVKATAKLEVATFKSVSADFIKDHVEKKGLRSQYEIVRCLNKYILPAWGTRPFTEVRRSDVVQLHKSVKSPRVADMVLSVTRRLMNWYAAQGVDDDYVVPIVKGMRREEPGERRRKRILDDAELRALWGATGDGSAFSALIRVLLLTGQRRGKVATMKWSDIRDGEWVIQEEKREKHTAGSLRLPPVVLELIERQPRISGCPYVFATSDKGPLQAFFRLKSELDAKLPEMPGWVLHDLRRTARSLMPRAGIADNVAERVLGHAIVGVHGTYNRHQYADEKADALVRLASLIDTIINPPKDNVIALRRKSKKGPR